MNNGQSPEIHYGPKARLQMGEQRNWTVPSSAQGSATLGHQCLLSAAHSACEGTVRFQPPRRANKPHKSFALNINQ